MKKKGSKISKGLKKLGRTRLTNHFEKLNVFEASAQSRINYLELFDYALVVDLNAGD